MADRNCWEEKRARVAGGRFAKGDFFLLMLQNSARKSRGVDSDQALKTVR
jgi:hypothetical protein